MKIGFLAFFIFALEASTAPLNTTKLQASSLSYNSSNSVLENRKYFSPSFNTTVDEDQVHSLEWGYWGWLDFPEYHYHNERCDLACQTFSHPYYPFTGFRVYQQFEMEKVMGLFPVVPKSSMQMVFCYRGIVTSVAETVEAEREYLQPDYEDPYGDDELGESPIETDLFSPNATFVLDPEIRQSVQTRDDQDEEAEGSRLWGRIFCFTNRDPFRPDVRGCYKLARRGVWKSANRNIFLRETNAGVLFKCHGCQDGLCKRRNRLGPQHDDFWCNENDMVTPSAPIVADEPYAGIFEIHNPWKFLYRQPIVYTTDYYSYMYPRTNDRYAAYVDVNEKYGTILDEEEDDEGHDTSQEEEESEFEKRAFSSAHIGRKKQEALSDNDYNEFIQAIKPYIPDQVFNFVLGDTNEEDTIEQYLLLSQNVKGPIGDYVPDSIKDSIPNSLKVSWNNIIHTESVSVSDIRATYSYFQQTLDKLPKLNRIIIALGAMPDRFKAMKLYNVLLDKSTNLSKELEEWGAYLDADGTIRQFGNHNLPWYQALAAKRREMNHKKSLHSRALQGVIDIDSEINSTIQDIYKVWDQKLEGQLKEFNEYAKSLNTNEENVQIDTSQYFASRLSPESVSFHNVPKAETTALTATKTLNDYPINTFISSFTKAYSPTIKTETVAISGEPMKNSEWCAIFNKTLQSIDFNDWDLLERYKPVQMIEAEFMNQVKYAMVDGTAPEISDMHEDIRRIWTPQYEVYWKYRMEMEENGCLV